MLSREFNIRVTHAVVPSECVRPAERLLIGTELAPDFLLASIVDGVFVPGKVVGSREERVTGLSGARVDAVAPVRTGLRVNQRRFRARDLWTSLTAEPMALPVAFPLMLL